MVQNEFTQPPTFVLGSLLSPQLSAPCPYLFALTSLPLPLCSLPLPLCLPIDAVPVVAADGFEVAEAARLIFFRRRHDEFSSSHLVEKFPNARNHIITNLLPLIIGNDTAQS